MTEAEWLNATDPVKMLTLLPQQVSSRKAGRRRLLLFAVGCARRWAHLLPSASARAALETAERFAEEGGNPTERAALVAALWQERTRLPTEPFAPTLAIRTVSECLHSNAQRAARSTAKSARITARLAYEDAWRAQFAAPEPRRIRSHETDESILAPECQAQSDLLREVFGNPFRSSPWNVTWTSRNDSLVRRMAERLYVERAFDRLPILADALEDADCSNLDLLGHLRGPGPHVRGCWAVDRCLGLA